MLGELALLVVGGVIGFVFAWVTSWALAYRARKPWWTIPALVALWGGGLAGPFAVTHFQVYLLSASHVFCYLLGLGGGAMFFFLCFFLSESFRQKAKPADRRVEDRKKELQVTLVVKPPPDVKNGRSIKVVLETSKKGLYKKAARKADKIIEESRNEEGQ